MYVFLLTEVLLMSILNVYFLTEAPLMSTHNVHYLRELRKVSRDYD